MKYKIILMFITLSVLLNSCVTNEYETPDSISDIGFYTSEGNANELNIGLLKYMTFTDLSQGALQHSWSIEKGDAFLKGPISRTATTANLNSRIIYPGDTVVGDKTVIVYFREPGLKKVRLYNTFRDSVAFRGNKWDADLGAAADYVVPAERLNDRWVIDTTFVVKVFDTIVPNIEVKQIKEGVEVSIDPMSTDTIYVEAGESLHVIDNTTQGEPTARNWFVRTKKDPSDNTSTSVQIAGSQEQDAQLLLKKLGVYEGGINISRSGELIPGDSEIFVFKSPIKVTPSSKPFGLASTIKELEDETLRLSFNGEFINFNNQEAFFEVKVNDVDFSVKSVTLDENDATFINIKLDDPIYRPDVITVSLLAGNTLKSTDSRSPVLFTDEAVVMHNVNLVPANIAGFEDTTSWSGFAPAWGANQGEISYSTDIKYKGNQSIKLTSVNGQRLAIESYLPSSVLFEQDVTYIMRFAMYIESSTVAPSEVSLWQLGQWSSLWVSPVQTQGEWKTFEREFKNWAPLARLYLRILPNGTTDSNITAYIDDIYIVTKEVRP
ncbi:hypothetical protein [Flavicella sediminum]|uniref:hypothetical protein n=1 Tax=Flavicella sediminum TaxID=2585141 RepID=UPI001122E1E4|nr:hypothetical protein [Flavicella sediminum]